ncbi:MAG: sodium-dependent transporter [Lachnospiraceae bacterium]|nr:sodium-dependent transporter [Lachnospiraceae bacterium]
MERERLGSRLGFLLLSAGCAIGIGNVWKFPYMCGQYGGGAFVLVYIFFLIVLGVPVMTMEFAMGRASRKSPVKLYDELAPKGSKWHIHGYFAMAGNYILMMFYTTVCGWMVQYFVETARGSFVGKDAAGVADVFSNMLASPVTLTIYMVIVVIIGFAVNSMGLQNGVEKLTKVMMVALMAIMVVLAFNSLFMDGGKAGLEFYLKPDFGKMQEIGVGKVIVGAMNQAFFTLSLGIGSMAIFGSYIGKERALMGESVRVAVLDTFVAISSGLIIFPACFAYGVQPDSGPPLIFITLPNIFNNIPMGRVWGTLFFVFMTFAAFSTVIAVFENIISCSSELFGWDRKKSCLINGIAMFFLSLPCVLGFNIWSSFQPLGPGTGVLDLEDFVVSNLLLPTGAMVYVLFCVTKYGWGWDKFVKEANEGKGLKVAQWMRPYMTFVLPVIILIILIMGLI